MTDFKETVAGRCCAPLEAFPGIIASLDIHPFCRQGPFDRGGQLLPPSVVAVRHDQTRVPIHQHGVRDAVDHISSGNCRIKTLAVIDLGPWHVMLFSEPGKDAGGVFLVEAYAQNFKTFGMKFLVSMNDIWRLRNARTTPGNPKIEKDHLASVSFRELTTESPGWTTGEAWKRPYSWPFSIRV